MNKTLKEIRIDIMASKTSWWCFANFFKSGLTVMLDINFTDGDNETHTFENVIPGDSISALAIVDDEPMMMENQESDK